MSFAFILRVVPLFFLMSPFLAHAADPSPAAAPVAPVTPASPDAPDPVADVAGLAPGDAKPDKPAISPAELDAMLDRLRAMRSGLDTESRRTVAEALRALAPAAAANADAANLWLASTRVTDFDRQNKTSADFEDWRKKNDDRLHDVGFASALRIQCRYLKLCLEADTKEKAVRAFPAIVALQEEAIRAIPTVGQYASALYDGVFDGPVAKRFGVTKFCPEEWPRATLDLDGHFRRAVTLALAVDSNSVPALWEVRLRLERALAEAMDKNAAVQKRRKSPGAAPAGKRGGHNGSGKDSKDADAGGDDIRSLEEFETLRLPRLLWTMGEDFRKAGLQRRAFEVLFGVIQKYPKHPDVSAWVDRITEMAEALKAGDDPAALAPKDTKSSDATPVPAKKRKV